MATEMMTSDFRKSAPQALGDVPFEVPTPFKTELNNGLRVVIVEDPRLPLVSYRLALGSGDRDDPADHSGIASAIASMLSEGTVEYTSLQLAEKIERLGASISANASDDFTIIAASTLSLYSTEILSLLAEVALRPTFPESELDLYRRNTLENLKYQRSQPNFLAGEQASRLIYGDHPYSRVSPSPANIEALTRDILIEAHAKNFVANDASLIVVGDVARDEVLAEIEHNFGGWPSGGRSPAKPTEPPNRTGRTLTIVDRPGSAQANIVLSNLAVPRVHPDYFPLIVMNQVLGAGASSRIFMNLREEKGYTYGAYTRLETKMLAGDFEATAEVRTTVTGESLKEFFYELGRIRDEQTSEQELADAKNFLTGVFPIRAETQEGLTNLILNQQLYGLPEDYLQTYRANVDAVTGEEVQRVARTHIRPDEMAIVIVGDAESILPQAREYADGVEIFDTDGVEQDEVKYVVSADEPPADAAGRWQLKIDFAGQSLPVTLVLEQDGNDVTGSLETMLGNGVIDEGRIRGNTLTATASTEMQGQPLELAITGKIDGDSMAGTVTAPIAPAPLAFTGTRER
jgi:zinc protease